MDYEWIEKTIFKKSDKKNKKKNRKSMSKGQNQCRKKTTSENWKFNSNKKVGLDWAVNGLGKTFRKKSDPKNRKNSKNQSEIAAFEQKTTTEKPNFSSNAFFSLYFRIGAKRFHAAKPLAFSLHFLFRRDQNHYSQFDFKNHENVWTDLKKRHPIQFKFCEL